MHKTILLYYVYNKWIIFYKYHLIYCWYWNLIGLSFCRCFFPRGRVRKEGEDMSFNFIVVFCFCKSHISIACFFTSFKKYISPRLLPLVPHDTATILLLQVSALFLVSLIQYVTSSGVDCICIPPGLGPPILSSLFCSVSIWLSSKLGTSFRYLSYLHVYWIM